MLEFLKNFFASGSFIPHGHCYLWKPELVWLHIISDSVIGLAYYSIPITLVYFVRKRQDLPFNWMFLLFGTFIVACGTTHIMEIWTLWHPTYWLSGSVKAVTATVSLYTAMELVPLVPKALALPSPAQLEAANQELRHQVAERQRAELALQKAKEELEVRVAERTTELSNTNEQLRVEIVERKQAESVLQQQTQRERLVAEIAHRIRQSLNLQEILSTTVAEVQQFLQAERVFIYRFEPDWSGVVVVESVGPGWPSILDTRIKETFFEDVTNRELYKQGRIQAVDDIYAGGMSQCHINLLAQFQIRANLVVPIVQNSSEFSATQTSSVDSQASRLLTQNSKLWGLLIANHCSAPRQWQQLEINLLKQLATQAAIAIQQSTLFEQVQTELIERKWAETEIKKLNENLKRRAAELEAMNRELEAFSYSISHDLRAPLRAMSGFSQILIRENTSQLTSEARRYLQMIQDNAQQMGRLIDDLLRFSRLSRLALKKQLVKPADLAYQAISDLQYEQQEQVKLSIHDLPECQADPALLKQVWVNLLANALKFTRQREEARIEVGYREISNEVAYFVKDNGIGFDMAYADKLFGVFQRLHLAEEYEGTGVGLAIVQRIIHRHGGHVWAESEVNKGATFYFTLGEDNRNDRGSSRDPISGRQPERRGVDPSLVTRE